MDEQNKKPVAEGEQAPKSGSGRNRRNRHRRHGNRRPEGAAPVTAETAGATTSPTEKSDTQAPSRPERGEGGKKKHGNQKGQGNAQGNGQGNGQGKPHGGNGQGKKRRDRHHGGGGNHRGLEDLYGNPTEDDVLTMEELRARIVLQAADGSIPSESKKQAEATTAQDETLTTVEFPGSETLIPMDEDPAPALPPEECVEVVGIRFRSSGKVYYFDPKGIALHLGDAAIVETARGPEFGQVSFANRMVSKKNTVSPLRPVLRVASEADILRNEENRKKEADALVICQQKIAAHGLEMKLIDVQYAFDNSRLLFYFTSEGRVDFRDLVKDLASVFRTRIELRQIGIRDEAKMLGGLGSCGRPLCCATFLSDFMQVSIKMAKEQGLSLNSSKISGACGRLMCCLRYESEVYAMELKLSPPHDATVKTPDGIGTVIGVSPLAGTVRVLLKNPPDTPPKQYRRDEVTVLGRDHGDEPKKG